MIRRKPYILLFIFELILLIYSLLRKNNNSLTINIHDVYYVIREIDLLILVISFVTFFSMVYLLFDFVKFKMILILSKIHVYGTTLMFLFFYILYYKMQIPVIPDKNFIFANYPKDYNFFIFIILLLIIFLQLLFLINIIVSLIKKAKSFRASRRT